MSIQGSIMSLSELSKINPLTRPRYYRQEPNVPADNDSDLEDMMTDSIFAGTPPLDLEFDSIDEDDDTDGSDPSMRSPLSPPLTQPVSILHRNRKNSQEYPFDHNQSQKDLSHAPALDNYGKGAQRRRRPTVTFSFDAHELASSPPAKLNIQRPNQIRQSDDSEIPEILETKDPVHHAEQALRRVSISQAEDNDENSSSTVAQNNNQDNTSDASLSTISITTNEISPPQENILSHIYTEAAPQDMLVALFVRPVELEALAARHSEFFALMYNSLTKVDKSEFKKMLFMPREDYPDLEWMRYIIEQFDSLPFIIERFKDIVGWIGPDSEDEAVHWSEEEYGCRDSSFDNVQIKWLRDIENFPIEVFKQFYPQFFTNARQSLEGRRMSHGGDQRDQYVIFCETLGLTRDELPCDNAWMRRMNCCLEKHPELLLQLKEIIAYEVDYDV
ncbi:hypothetical protein BGZ76_011271 [Entomortierella beljakovae]|nr:hypothetical protein BGZ76_011271 [Entomortierella beljakovae]